VSWSGLKRYEGCHQQHYRSSIQRKSLPVNSRVFLPGTAADRIMREWLNSPDPRPGQMVEAIDPMLDRLTKPELADEDFRKVQWKGNAAADRAGVREFVRLVLTELEPMLLQWVVPHDYQPELRFATTVHVPYLDGKPAPITLTGGIDIVVRLRHDVPSRGLSAGEFVLFDLKATKDSAYIDATLGQGIFYDIAFGHWWGDVTEPKSFGFIVPAIDEKMVWTGITDYDRRVMVSRIVKMAQSMWAEHFEPKVDDDGCQWCEVRHVCDKFAVPISKDAAGKNRASFELAAQMREAARAAAEEEAKRWAS
jgi:hypothetical protein